MPTVKVRQDEFTPATYNNPDLTKRLVAVLQKALGNDKVEKVDPTMGGEDFSEFSLLPIIRSRPACSMSGRWIRRSMPKA